MIATAQGLSRVFLGLVGIAFLALGAFSLAHVDVVAKFIGLVATTPSSWSELRGSYGGVHLALGVFLLLAARRPSLETAALWMVGVISTGYVVGRAASFVADGPPPAWVLGAAAAELGGAVVVGLLLKARAGRQP